MRRSSPANLVAILSALLVLGLGAWLTALDAAESKAPLMTAIRNPIIHLLGRDLTASIAAYKSAGGPAIPNGGYAGYGGGYVTIPVKITVLNRGPGAIAAGASVTHVRITRGGSVVVDQNVPESVALSSGASSTHMYSVPCPSITNKIHVEATVDSGGAVTESSESNNTAKYDCTVEVVH